MMIPEIGKLKWLLKISVVVTVTLVAIAIAKTALDWVVKNA